MDSYLQMTFSNSFLEKENIHILCQIWLKFVLKGWIDNRSALVQVIARRPTGDKPLPEPMLNIDQGVLDASWHHILLQGHNELTH